MAPSRRQSNGRSPLVRKQSQITSFFSPGKSSSPLATTATPNSSPNPSPEPTSNPNPSPSSGPTPPPSKWKKPLLVIGHTPVSSSKVTTTPSCRGERYGDEVVGRKLRVFWPLDKAWYDGYVKSFDEDTGKHVVQYDDAEEEELDLQEEKIEWAQEEPPRNFRRLRRRISISDATVCVEEGSSEGDSTDDDDWGKAIGDEIMEDESEEMGLVDDDEDEEEPEAKSLRRAQVTTPESRKRHKPEVEKVDSVKKDRIGSKGKVLSKAPAGCGGSASKVVEAKSNCEKGKTLDILNNTLTNDAVERFGKREAEKFRFLRDFFNHYVTGRKDAKGRRPGDANYDPKTLYLPQDFLRSLSGGQRQWWEFKSKHMDKVLFFKMGKFYELFEMDAHIGARELDLQYMKGEQPHCGFPEKNFSMNLEKLARKGYRVLVVEQTETPEQLEFRRKETGSKDKVVKREICAVVTKGTLTEGELLLANPDVSYIMSLTEKRSASENQKEETTVLGVCVVDVSTSKFVLGQFEDDAELHFLCSILSELRPVEIIKPSNVLSPETERVLWKHTRSPLVNELVPSSEFWDAEKTIDEVRNMYQRLRRPSISGPLENDIYSDFDDVTNGSACLPNVLSELVSAGENGSYALSAFGGCLFYLRQALLDGTLLTCAKFESLPYSGFLGTIQKPYMILDASALENLEILENNRDGGHSGTLFSQLDHCVTAFGKRLLKSWLARPLFDSRSIMERQDALAGLKGVSLASATEFRKELLRLPDMERLLARIFATCEANGRNANKVILYEDAAKRQLREFLAALRGCQLMIQACSSLSTILASTESSLLHHILTPGKGLPYIYSVIEHFKESFDWAEAENSGRILPREGADFEYDNACKSVKDIESILTRHLKEQRKLLGDASINYVTVGKDLYLLEVPEDLRSNIPRDYELQSSKKGFFRYWTPQIKKWLVELSQAEAEKESKLKNILQRLIKQFCEHHSKWRQLVSAIAELDVLISLAIASDYYEGSTCRPTIKAMSHSDGVVPYLRASGLGHPILRSDALGKGSFVPNDVNIGGDGHASFILLTGPNMGGKSTLLRQVCMAVILAQIGADVPAEKFELSPVDRIFVRMGARDHIMAGQSTFLTELSETAAMLSSATDSSLVALDELGRGTSTSDGQAIAEAVLEHFVHNVRCRGMFSTHYHRLSVAYEKDPKVSLCHMSCQVGKGVAGIEEVTFLYRLTPGPCPKSYGVNVARLAGLPGSVLQKAASKSSDFEVMYGKSRSNTEIKSSGHIRNDETTIVQDFLNVVTPWNCNENLQVSNLRPLIELQQRARLLLKGI